MSEYHQMNVSQLGDVALVRLLDENILDDLLIREIGAELYRLVDVDHHKKIVVSFAAVRYLSSAMLGKLIALSNKAKDQSAALKLCSIRPEVYEVFATTKLNRILDIEDTEDDAMGAFGR